MAAAAPAELSAHAVASAFLGATANYFESNGDIINDDAEMTYNDVVDLIDRLMLSPTTRMLQKWAETQQSAIVHFTAAAAAPTVPAVPAPAQPPAQLPSASLPLAPATNSAIVAPPQLPSDKPGSELERLEREFAELEMSLDRGLQTVKAKYDNASASPKVPASSIRPSPPSSAPDAASPSPAATPLQRTLSPLSFYFSDSDDNDDGEADKNDRVLLGRYFTSRERGAPAEAQPIELELSSVRSVGLAGIGGVVQQMAQHVTTGGFRRGKAAPRTTLTWTPEDDQPTVVLAGGTETAGSNLYYMPIVDLRKPRSHTVNDATGAPAEDDDAIGKLRSRSLLH